MKVLKNTLKLAVTLFCYICIGVMSFSVETTDVSASSIGINIVPGKVEKDQSAGFRTPSYTRPKRRKYKKNTYGNTSRRNKRRSGTKHRKNNEDKKKQENVKKKKVIKKYEVELSFADATSYLSQQAADLYKDIDRSKGDSAISCTYVIYQKKGEQYKKLGKTKKGKGYKGKLPKGEYKVVMDKKGYMKTSYNFKVSDVFEKKIGIHRIHSGLKLKICGPDKNPLPDIEVAIWDADKTKYLLDNYQFSSDTHDSEKYEKLIKKTNKKGILELPLIAGKYSLQILDDRVTGLENYTVEGMNKFFDVEIKKPSKKSKDRKKVVERKHKSPNPKSWYAKEEIKEKKYLKLNIYFTKAKLNVAGFFD